MALFNSFANNTLKSDSAKAVHDALSGRYNVRRVREGYKGNLFGSTYYVDLKDGSTMKVKVDKRTSLFGNEQVYIKGIED